MARVDVELVHEAFGAFNAGDLERILELTDPDFEAVVPPELSAEPDVYRGREGMRRYWESFREVMEDIRFDADRFWEAPDCVVVAFHINARGRSTAIPVEQRIWGVWRIREARVLEIRAFATAAQALRCAGLPADRG
jgi:uncharacterized protein